MNPSRQVAIELAKDATADLECLAREYSLPLATVQRIARGRGIYVPSDPPPLKLADDKNQKGDA